LDRLIERHALQPQTGQIAMAARISLLAFSRRMRLDFFYASHL
jgi:hypothetical protein